MNDKKEFEEKYCDIEYSADGKRIVIIKYEYSGKGDELWSDIEQYGKQQRIDELNREELNDIVGHNTFFAKYKFDRIKELEGE